MVSNERDALETHEHVDSKAKLQNRNFFCFTFEEPSPRRIHVHPESVLRAAVLYLELIRHSRSLSVLELVLWKLISHVHIQISNFEVEFPIFRPDQLFLVTD